jgi:hypothetical protein
MRDRIAGASVIHEQKKHGRRTLAGIARTLAVILIALGMNSCKDGGTLPPEETDGTTGTDGVIFIGDIPGFPTSLWLEDSLGHTTTFIRAGDPLWLRYAAVNQTGGTLTWSTGMSYPFARFLIKQGADTLVDSFYGFAFLAVPSTGVLANGDSLRASWRLDPAKYPLNAGVYTAIALPKYIIGRTDIPNDETADFSIAP